MFITRISNHNLSTLCERVGVAFDVGHDPLRIFEREAGDGRTRYGRHMLSIAERVKKGGSLADAIHAQGNYFPGNFVRLIEVGEKTGRLEKVLDRMSEYYKDIAELTDEFKSSIIWPLIQLFLGLLVIGFLIYIPELLAPSATDVVDMLGIGLVGGRGLAIYLTGVAGLAILAAVLSVLARNGRLAFLGNLLTRLPFVGRSLLSFDEATFVQTLSLAVEAGMDAWNSIALAFKSASSDRFKSRADAAQEAIRQGREMHLVLQETGLFCKETIEAVQLGEESGRLAETLDKHSRFLRMKVKFAMATLTHMASSVVWILVSSLLIIVIFRIFTRYVGGLQTVTERFYERGSGK